MKFLIFNFKFLNKNRDRGQVALVVLLISAVALTLGLVTSKRSTVETKLDTQEEQLQRAFNAAESGLESYLANKQTEYSASDGKATAEVTSSSIGNSQTIDSSGMVSVNNPMVFWLVGHSADGETIDMGTVYTGNTATLCASGGSSSLKVAFYYLEGTTYRVKRSAYNFNRMMTGNIIQNAADSDTTAAVSCPTGYSLVTSFTWTPATQRPLAVVVVPVFRPINLAMAGNNNFPTQGLLINSVGKDSSGEAQRSVTQELRWNSGILNYLIEGMTAEGGITTQ